MIPFINANIFDFMIDFSIKLVYNKNESVFIKEGF